MSLDGKTAVITGANRGIGYETAKNFAQNGAKVIIACRNQAQGEEASTKIKQETGNEKVHFMPLDLASFRSVREFVDKFKSQEERLDILVNNAGMAGNKERILTEDGNEVQMQVNHLGHFLLTNLMLDVLKKSAPSRVVNVSSDYHRLSPMYGFDLDDLNSEKVYTPNRTYSTTKVCNILFTKYLAKELENTGVTVNALHPGVINTGLFANLFLESEKAGVVKNAKKRFWDWFLLTPEQGAKTSIYVATEPKLENVTGAYFKKCRQSWILPRASNMENAAKLWEISKKLTKLD